MLNTRRLPLKCLIHRTHCVDVLAYMLNICILTCTVNAFCTNTSNCSLRLERCGFYYQCYLLIKLPIIPDSLVI